MSDESDRVPFATALNHLLEESAEVFILGIEVFRTAISGVFSQDPEVAQCAMELTDECTARAEQLRRQTVGMLAQWVPQGAALNRVLSIDRIAEESVAISRQSQHIADHSLALRGTADQCFLLVHQRASEVFLSLVQQVYIGLRGCLALTSLSDRALAERVIAEDAQVHHLEQMLTRRIEQVSSAMPQHAGELGHLVNIVQACRQIGSSVVTICRDALSAPRYVRATSFPA